MNPILQSCRFLLLSLAVVGTHQVTAGVPALLDNFDDAQANAQGVNRLIVNDAMVGGKSTLHQSFADGVLQASGKIVPARGQPGFISTVILLSPDGQPHDLSEYEGIRLKIQVTKGNVTVLAASAEITNFDYHATVVPRTGKMQEIRIPFADLKRVWSEQVPLNLSTITSINLVASHLQPGEFAYEVDEIGFY
jgi:hypothetical protein